MRMYRRGIAAAIAASIGLLSVAACGGSSSSGEEGTIRLVVSEGNSLPFIAAEAGDALGVWEKNGIDVQIIDATSPTVGPTMASGEADISLQAGNKAAADIIAGLDAKLTAGCVLPWDQYLVASPDTHASKLADLKGKRFGISGFGSAGHYATLKSAQSLGWSSSDYKLVQLGSLESLIAGLKNHTIDAFVWSIEPVLTAEQKGYGTNLGSVADLVGPNAFEAFTVSDSVTEDRPDDVRAFFKGYYESVHELQNNPQRAIDFVVDEWGTDRSVASKTVPKMLPLLSDDGDIPQQNLKGLADSIHLTVEDVGDFDINSVYEPWQDIGQ